jgi:hypothetical protein
VTAVFFRTREARGGNPFPPRAACIETGFPSLLSCVRCARHHPLARTRRFDCLAEAAPLAPHRFRWEDGCRLCLLLLEALSSERSLSITSGQGWHRKPLRPLRSLRGYSCSSPPQSRGEDASGVRLFRHVTRLPPGHRLQRALFALISGDGIQKLLPYPSCSTFSLSASSLWRLTGKGLLPLSSLSFSRSAVWAESRARSSRGSSVLAPGNSRRQRVFYEPLRGLSPR